MDTKIERRAQDLEQWRSVATTIYRAGEAMIQAGQRVHVTLGEDQDTLTLRQLRFFHGPVLQQISEQVVVGGVRYAREVWKEHLKDLFIPDHFEMRRAPFVRDARTGAWRPSKRAVPVRRPKHISELGVKRCSLFIDQVLAHAATEWGVEFVFEFDEREAVRYVPPRSKQKRKDAPRAKPIEQQQADEVPA